MQRLTRLAVVAALAGCVSNTGRPAERPGIVQPEPPTGGAPSGARDDFEGIAGGEELSLDPPDWPEPSLPCTVIDDQGAPLAWATVLIYAIQGPHPDHWQERMLWRGQCDAAGTVALPATASGYVLRVRPQRRWSPRLHYRRVRGDADAVQVVVPRTGQIRVHLVSPDGATLRPSTLWIRRSLPTAGPMELWGGGMWRGPGGTVIVHSLLPGVYEVAFAGDGYARSAVSRVQVAAGQLTDIGRVKLDRGGASFQVRVRLPAKPAGNERVEGTVHVERVAASGFDRWEATARCPFWDSDTATVTINGAPPGRYVARVQVDGYPVAESPTAEIPASGSSIDLAPRAECGDAVVVVQARDGTPVVEARARVKQGPTTWLHGGEASQSADALGIEFVYLATEPPPGAGMFAGPRGDTPDAGRDGGPFYFRELAPGRWEVQLAVNSFREPPRWRDAGTLEVVAGERRVCTVTPSPEELESAAAGAKCQDAESRRVSNAARGGASARALAPATKPPADSAPSSAPVPDSTLVLGLRQYLESLGGGDVWKAFKRRARAPGAAELFFEALAGMPWDRLSPWHDDEPIDWAIGLMSVLGRPESGGWEAVFQAAHAAMAAHPDDAPRLAIARVCSVMLGPGWDPRSDQPITTEGPETPLEAARRMAGDGTPKSQAWLIEHHLRLYDVERRYLLAQVLIESTPATVGLPRALRLYEVEAAKWGVYHGRMLAPQEAVACAIDAHGASAYAAIAGLWPRLTATTRASVVNRAAADRARGESAGWSVILGRMPTEASPEALLAFVQAAKTMEPDAELVAVIKRLGARSGLPDDVARALKDLTAAARATPPERSHR